MKKWIIGSLVGAIIVMIWQFASWMFLPIHDKQAKYSASQDQILNVLNTTITEDGMYMLPSAPTKKEQQDMMKTMDGKPWATVIYHKAKNADMTMRIIRSFLVYFFLVVSLIYVLSRGGTPTRMRSFSGSFAMGLFAFAWGEYQAHIWFDLPWHMILGDLVDSLVAWSLCGIWVGWWLNRKPKATMAAAA